MNNWVLEASEISKSFTDGQSQIDVLQQVSIQVQPAEMVAIIGSSGSGKSTLLHILGGLDSPDSGTVYIQGTDIHQLSTRKQGEWRNQYLGFVYQFHHLLAEFSAQENVMMPLLIGGMDYQLAQAEAEQIITRVGLQNRLTHKPAKLSGGERQRIAIARAMVTKPACILADEPTGNLDTQTAESVNELMRELSATENTSFLIVSHDLRLAKSLQKTYQMMDGKLNLFKQ
ncbi:lipoprotein-releasing ABC transporter ATP-binding protein LolD [Aliikangiella maris]|uniref:Lipoprotein-releasing system ATP-binding protein LolD n=2 Tax=Aliikangiella maris TaxID=3162458 RepID=A0ABV3MIH1_9GAMM